ALTEHHEAHARIFLPDELDGVQARGRSAPRRVAVQHPDARRIVDRPGLVVELLEVDPLHHRAHRVLIETVAQQALQPGRDRELDRGAAVRGLDLLARAAPDLVALDEVDRHALPRSVLGLRLGGPPVGGERDVGVGAMWPRRGPHRPGPQAVPRWARTYVDRTSSQRRCARRMRSMTSRKPPWPRAARVTSWATALTSSAASATATASPARCSAGMSRRSSPM